MTRRLRLALLLAALVTAGPSAAAPHDFLAPRVLVSIAWPRANPACHPQQHRSQPATPVAVAERAEFCAQPAHSLPDSFCVHSLFQRPPPLLT